MSHQQPQPRYARPIPFRLLSCKSMINCPLFTGGVFF